MDLEQLQKQLADTGSLTLNLKVIPKSSRNEVVGVQPDGSLKLKVTVAPEKGKANAAVCELLADFFGVSRGKVVILRGETSQTKQVQITS